MQMVVAQLSLLFLIGHNPPWLAGTVGAHALSVLPMAIFSACRERGKIASSLSLSSTNNNDEWIEYQSNHGRGQDHLSAFVEEGDVVVYQGGTWYVDGVEVGDGTDTTFEYCRVETLQVVWTHNCEHGVIRGYQMVPTEDSDCGDDRDECTTQSMTVSLDDSVEFGPEQLVARLTKAEWDDEEIQEGTATFPVPLAENFWETKVLEDHA